MKLKRKLVVVFECDVTEKEYADMLREHGDEKFPDVELHGINFKYSQFYCRLPAGWRAG